MSPTGVLFGEDAGRVVLSVPHAKRDQLAAIARRHRINLFGAGRVTADAKLTVELPERTLGWDVRALRATYMDAIPRRMAQVATGGA